MRKSLLAAAVAAGLLVSGAVLPEPYGMGGGYGPGYGMGPGAGGYGMGGPGMMGGYGPGGYGMGPGMMGGSGPGNGMGPGFMGGYGLGNLDLTAEQRTKIEGIQHDFERKQWKLMEGMHELMWQQRDANAGGKFDEKSARQAYDAREQLHKQMFEASLEARKQIDAVLTPEQRQKLGRSAG